MRRRIFSQDPRYIALQELTGEGKYRGERANSDASDHSATYTPGFKKRMSDAFSRRDSGLSLTSSTRWKRNSLTRAVSAARDALGAMPRCGRGAAAQDEAGVMGAAAADRKRDKKRMSFRESWSQGWKTLPLSELGGHTTLLVPIS
ncbi:hypothetical protein PWT90_08565 [Aphanocladium album]|nr:hypothetical protein PWT90_08565 [Aphanocladium album]